MERYKLGRTRGVLASLLGVSSGSPSGVAVFFAKGNRDVARKFMCRPAPRNYAVEMAGHNLNGSSVKEQLEEFASCSPVSTPAHPFSSFFFLSLSDTVQNVTVSDPRSLQEFLCSFSTDYLVHETTLGLALFGSG